MTKMKTTDWDALAAGAPVNAAADAVTTGRGNRHFEPAMKPHSGHFHSHAPPKMRPRRELTTEISRQKHDELVGKRINRLIVVGLAVPLSDSRTARRYAQWVVRCDCGMYETRKSKALRNPNPRPLHSQCRACQTIETNRLRYEKLGAAGLDEFLEAEQKKGNYIQRLTFRT